MTAAINGDGFTIRTSSTKVDKISGFPATFTSLPARQVDARDSARPRPSPRRASPRAAGHGHDLGTGRLPVLIIDQIGYGDRRSHPFNQTKISQLLGSRKTISFAMTRRAASTIGRQPDGLDGLGPDARRRLLLPANGIDPKRIAHLGAVAGGGDPAGVMAALDYASPAACRSTSAAHNRKHVIRSRTMPRQTSTTWPALLGHDTRFTPRWPGPLSTLGIVSSIAPAAHPSLTNFPGIGTTTRFGTLPENLGRVLQSGR